MAVAATLSLWAAVAVLARAVLALDTTFVYVIEQTRPDLALPLRFSALWSGAEGSLLLFGAMVATALLVGHRAGPWWQQAGAGVVATGLAAASLLDANPFARVDLPPLSGSGMAPILEHWAMVIHPPLLYAGMVLALAPALVRPRASAHRWAMAALAVLTIALALGSAWAYVELGWGGWWAWDPIENVALIIWLLLAAALHWRPLDRRGLTGSGALNVTVLHALCWPAVFGGAALTRTSLRTSVHAFADAAGLSVWLWPLTVVVAVGAVLRVWEDRRLLRSTDGAPANRWFWRRTPVVVVTSVALVVAAGTYRPFIGGDGTAGFFYSRTLYPLAVCGALLIGYVPIRHRPWRKLSAIAGPAAGAGVVLAVVAGWGEWFQVVLAGAVAAGAAMVVSSGRASSTRLAGHLGILFIVFGALAGTGSTETTVLLVEGESQSVGNHQVELVSTAVTDRDPLTAEARIRIDGAYDLAPSVAVYPERGLRLPEVATRTRPWLDTQAVLREVDPEAGTVITLLFRPWNQLVWWGAALLTVAAVLSGRATARRLSAGPASPSGAGPSMSPSAEGHRGRGEEQGPRAGDRP